MGAGPAAVLLTGYAVDPVFVRGGAQRVAAELCDRLMELGWTIQVIECVAWRESVDQRHSFLAGMAGHRSTARWWRNDGPPTVTGPEDVDATVRSAQLVLVIDRAVGQLDSAGHRVLLLSNLAYDNERRAVAHGDHHAVWVASPFLARQVAAAQGQAPVDVRVVPPALAASRCDPTAHAPVGAVQAQLTEAAVPRNRRLLFPHRADPGKGLTTAVDVLRHLLEQDRWALVIVEPGVGEGADATAALDVARRESAGIADHLYWVPWMPQSEVFCLYRLAAVTLMPTTLEEGFGLVAAESLTQGVPVVARSAGNLATLAERFSSVHLADEITAMVRTVAAVSGRAVPPDERRAVHRAFSVAAQRAAVKVALPAVAAGI